MTKLVSALLVRNEAGPDRYLRRVLERCATFSDEIVVLDDRSTDATPQLCADYGATVHQRSVLTNRAWGTESPARAELWDLATSHCHDESAWVLVVDADMVLVGDPRPYLDTREVNAWAFILYDLWDNDTTYRSDQFWVGHRVPRVWLVAPRRVPHDYIPDWPARGIHPGHVPSNFPVFAGVATDLHWLHLGWLRPDHREIKYKQYISTADQLSPEELAHVESIHAT